MYDECYGYLLSNVFLSRFMNWADSPYNTEHILESLENDGKQGNKVPT